MSALAIRDFTSLCVLLSLRFLPRNWYKCTCTEKAPSAQIIYDINLESLKCNAKKAPRKFSESCRQQVLAIRMSSKWGPDPILDNKATPYDGKIVEADFDVNDKEFYYKT